MKQFIGIPEGPVTDTPPILTVGMFDGVHRGHLAVIREMQRAFAVKIEGHSMQVTALGQTRAQGRCGGANLVKELPQGCLAAILLKHREQRVHIQPCAIGHRRG